MRVASLRYVWFLLPIFCAFSCGKSSPSKLNVVYGDDDRYEIFEIGDLDNPNNNDPKSVERSRLHQQLSKSVAVLVANVDIDKRCDPNYARLLGGPLSEYINLCKDVRFRDQPSVGFCTAFLVAPDIMVTAAHCIHTSRITPDPCRSISAVFDFSYDNQDGFSKDVGFISKNNIYKCDKIISIDKDQDYALFRVERAVSDRSPLSVRKQGHALIGTAVSVIGHPNGIPQKVTLNGHILMNLDDSHFYASVDTNEGNSGSPVFNSKTGLVEGILIGGHDDWQLTEEGCFASFVCDEVSTDYGCFGEAITRSSSFSSLIK